MTLGQRLKAYRQAKGLSQEQLAEQLNVSRQAITKWENDKGLPDIDNLLAISRLFGVTLDELVSGETTLIDDSVKDRKKKMNGILINMAIFYGLFVLWIIIGCVNLGQSYKIVPCLNFFCSACWFAVACYRLKQYLSLKEQDR